jgi:adenylate cyclase
MSFAAVRDWLVDAAWTIPEPAELVDRWTRRLVEAGLPLQRMSVIVSTMHPEIVGMRYFWTRSANRLETLQGDRTRFGGPGFERSPFRLLIDEGAQCIRRRLEGPPDLDDFDILEELRAEGATDYVVQGLPFISETRWMPGRRGGGIMSLSTDRKGGFTTKELVGLNATLGPFARLLEVHAIRRIGADLLDVYVGRRAGERIFSGELLRGAGESLDAVIWLSDLRGSTALSDTLPRDAYIALLDEWFDALDGPIRAHGGEILKFIGDGLLAIFACGNDPADAARRAVASAQAAVEALRSFPHGYGIALHRGEVAFGNVGARERLDFTVIGPAVNLAHRLERVAKALDRRVVFSASVAAHVPSAVPLGRCMLEGVREPQEVFGLP